MILNSFSPRLYPLLQRVKGLLEIFMSFSFVASSSTHFQTMSSRQSDESSWSMPDRPLASQKLIMFSICAKRSSQIVRFSDKTRDIILSSEVLTICGCSAEKLILQYFFSN
jgi:hypothetical protein